MSIEAHHCNVPGCKGFVVFENADFDFKDMRTDEKRGVYAFANPRCTECGKEFLVVPHYAVIDFEAEETIESACITEYERREQQRKFDAETDPSLRIMNYIIQCGYTYAVHEVVAEYSRYKETGCYLSHTMKDCVRNLKDELEEMLSAVS
jgi:tRNA 2-selenouridine synthase SelU